MNDRKITIGNATYNVSRQFDDRRTIQEAIRESINPVGRMKMQTGHAVKMPMNVETHSADML